MEWINTGRGFGALIFIEEVHIMMIRTKFLNAFFGVLLVMAMVTGVGCITGKPRIDTYTVYEESPYDLKNAVYEDKDILLTINPTPRPFWAGGANYDRRIYSFALSITNKSSRDMSIDWVNVYFINKGQLDGGFIHEGGSSPSHTRVEQPFLILTNSTRIVNLIPNQLNTWKLWPMEDGTFGVYISKVNDQEKRIKVTVDIGVSVEQKIEVTR